MTPTVVQDQQGLDQFFASVARDFGDTNYSAYLHSQLPKLEKLHKLYFDAEQDPTGAGWPALAPSTIQRKGHDRILYESGRLRESLAGKSGDSLRDVIDEGAMSGLAFGTTVPYSLFHDKATENRPARPHVGINLKVLDKIAEGALAVALARLKPVT